jgi:hypothetical protein
MKGKKQSYSLTSQQKVEKWGIQWFTGTIVFIETR